MRRYDEIETCWACVGPPPRLRKRTCRVRAEVALLYGFTPRRNARRFAGAPAPAAFGRWGRPRQDSAMGEDRPDFARLPYRLGHQPAVTEATPGDRYQTRGPAPSIWRDVRSGSADGRRAPSSGAAG